MAEISEIIAKEAITAIENADKAINAVDESTLKLIKTTDALTASLKAGGVSFADLQKYSKQTAETAKELNAQQKEAAKATAATEKANKAAADSAAKLAAKQREHIAALTMEVKTVQEAQRQNKALTEERNKARTTLGKQSVEVQNYNKQIQQNTEFIRSNGTAMEKQRMNIGNYGSALDGVRNAAGLLMGALGITAGLAGVMQLVQGVIASTGAAADELEFTMSGLKEQAQFTARAFANWDFSNFLAGLKEANAEGRRYAETLDLIGDLNRANQLQTNDIERQIIEQRIIAKNKSNEIGVREAAIKEIIRLEELKLTQVKTITKKGIDNELENSAFRTKASQAEVLDLVKNYDKKVSAIEQGNQLIADIEAKTREKITTREGFVVSKVDVEARKKAFDDLNASQKESVRLAKLDAQLTDEKKAALVSAVDADQKATNEMLSGKESLVRLENSLRSELIKTETQQTKRSKAVVETTEKEAKALKEISYLISANTESEWNATEAKIAANKAREIANKLIEDEADALLALSDAQYSADIAKVQGAKTTAALGGLDPLTLGQQFAAMTPEEKTAFAVEQAQTLADTTFTILSDRRQAEFDLEMAMLEKEKNAKLSNANLTEKEKAKIEADFAKKAARMKQDNFKKEKAAAIIQSLINTAIAVTANLKFPWLAIAAGIAGAAQTAIIAAQPIPQFDAGTASTPATFDIAERRPEFIRKPGHRNFELITKRTRFKNMAGATVIGGEQTKRMIEQGIAPGAVDIRPDIEALRSDVVNAIQSKHELHISASGARITERAGSYNKEYFNRKIQWQRKAN